MRRYLAPLAALCGCLLLAPLARADTEREAAERVAHARVLGEQAADLLDAKNYTEALARATQAESLFHAPTHMLMIGEANEALGHLAAAADTYEALVAEPLPRSAPRAFLSAQATGKQRLNPLLARVPSVLVKVQGAASSGVKATVDGRPFAMRPGIAARLDAGRHALRITSAGYRPSEQTITLPDKGGVTILDLVLEPEPAGTAMPEPSPAVGTALPEPVAPPPPPVVAEQGASPRSRLPAYIAFGAGGAGIALGSVMGILSLSDVGTLKGHCTGDVCGPQYQSTLSSAKTLGWVSTVAFGVGIAGVGAGVVLLLLKPAAPLDATPRDRAASLAPSVAPWIGVGSAGVEGRF